MLETADRGPWRAFNCPQNARVRQILMEKPAWQSLGESNPSFQVENLTS